MQDSDVPPDAARLADLLDGVHRAVLVADLASLGALSDETEALLARIGPIRNADLCSRLRQKALRNEACLKAATRGLRAARRRLHELQQAGQGLATYDLQGQRCSVAQGAAGLTRRL